MSDHFGTIQIPPDEQRPSPANSAKDKEKSRSARPPKQPGGKRSTSVVVTLAVLALLLGTYVAMGVWGLPYLLSTRLPLVVSRHSDMTLHLGKVRFNPLNFKLKFTDITLTNGDKDNRETILTLDSIVADIAPIPIFKGEFVTTGLTLDTLAAHIVRNAEGNYNLSWSTSENRPLPASSITTLRALPFRFSLNNITLTRGSIVFDDKPNNATHQIDRIEASLPNLSNFSFQSIENIHPKFSAVINGSPIELTGEAVISGNSMDTNGSLKTELSCSFNGIDLRRYFGYLPFELPFALTEGRADGSLRLTFAQSKAANIFSVDFSMQAEGVAIESADNSFSLIVPTAKLEGAIHPLTGKTLFRKIELREPAVQVGKDFSFQHFTALANLVAVKEGTDPARIPEVTIDHLSADNGAVLFTDKEGNSQSGWHALRLSLKNYNTKRRSSIVEEQPLLRLSGQQSGTRATFNLQGHIDEHLLPNGDLLLNDFSARQLFGLIGIAEMSDATGTVDSQARIGFNDYPNIDIVSRITVDDGVINFSDLSVKENDHLWFSAPATKFAGLRKRGKKISLGSVYLSNSLLDLQTDALPTLVKRLGSEKGNISIEALEFTGDLKLSNTTRKVSPLHFSEVSLQAINLARLESSSGHDNLTLSARLGKTGEVQAKGRLRLHSFMTTLNMGFAGLDGATIFPWFGDSPLFDTLSVRLSGKGNFSFPFVNFEGQLLLQNGTLITSSEGDAPSPTLNWQEINLEDFRYKSSPLSIGASQCTVTSPTMPWGLTDASPHPLSELSAFFQENLSPLTKGESGSPPPPALELQSVHIQHGHITYHDDRISPIRQGEIADINGTIDKLVSDPNAPGADFSFTGNYDTLPFTLQGNIHLFTPKPEGYSTLNLDNYPISLFSDYWQKELDLDPTRGTVSVTDSATWRKGTLTHSTRFTFDDLSPRSQEAPTTLSLALALLGGADNRFTLRTQGEHKLTAPAPPLFVEGIDILHKQVLKAAVSPLLLVSSEYSDLMGQEFAEFEPGKILLTAGGQESVAKFSNLLTDNPKIGLTITGCADSKIDGNAIKRDLEKLERERTAKENARREALLEEAVIEYRQKQAEKLQEAGKSEEIFDLEIPEEITSRLAPLTPKDIIVDKTMLVELAKQRARLVGELITEELALEPSHITIAKQVAIDSDGGTSNNQVRFAITLLP